MARLSIIVCLGICFLAAVQAENEPASDSGIETKDFIAYNDREYAVLQCKLTGNTAVGDNISKMKWSHRGSPLDLSLPRYTVSHDNDTSTLNISAATRGDEGEYFCSLSLDNGSSFNTSAILYMGAQVEKAQKSKNVIQGDPLHLECKAFGYPTPTVAWKKGEALLDTSDSRITLSDYESNGITIANGTLRIENLDFDDRADYVCEVSGYNNTLVNATTLVRVKDKLAALWPFLGICAEVTILCIIIFIYEKRRAKKMEEEEAQEEADHLTNSHAHRGNEEIRQRK